MTPQELKDKLEAIGRSVPDDIFKFSDGTNATELNTAHHFAIRLSQEFPKYHCDFDLSKLHEVELSKRQEGKPNSGYRRPDIILHERRTHARNFLVVEMKLRGDPATVDGDAEKIQNVWFAEPFRYEFGATVVLNEDGCAAHVMPNPHRKA